MNFVSGIVALLLSGKLPALIELLLKQPHCLELLLATVAGQMPPPSFNSFARWLSG